MTPSARRQPPVDEIFAALGDPTRRSVFEAVVRDGPVTATALSADRPISRQAVTKHLERLAAAGLTSATRVGRETRWSADVTPLAEAVTWMSTVGDAWDARLDRLAQRFRRS